jgi:hypothetical protein
VAKPTDKTIDPSNAEQLGEFLYERHREYTLETGDGREPPPWDELRPWARKVWLKTARDAYERFKPEAP